MSWLNYVLSGDSQNGCEIKANGEDLDQSASEEAV